LNINRVLGIEIEGAGRLPTEAVDGSHALGGNFAEAVGASAINGGSLRMSLDSAELEKVASLYRRGVLSKREFDYSKRNLVGKRKNSMPLRIADEIEGLISLKDRGVISDKEFLRKKGAVVYGKDAGFRFNFDVKSTIRLAVVIGGLFLLKAVIGDGQSHQSEFKANNTVANDGGGEVGASNSTHVAAKGDVSPVAPAQQLRFVAINEEFRSRYLGTQNDLVRGSLADERAKKLGELVSSGQVSRWIGKVDHISDAGSKLASFSVVVGDEIQVGTSDTLFGEPGQLIGAAFDKYAALGGQQVDQNSQPVEGSLIDPKSPLYQQLLKLHVGQTVEFSGHFYPKEDGGIADSSILSESSIMTPSYKFKFETIVPK